MELRNCGCGVVPLYEGKGGEGELACDVMRISHGDQNRKAIKVLQYRRVRRDGLIRGPN
jgi:hypothetical protein